MRSSAASCSKVTWSRAQRAWPAGSATTNSSSQSSVAANSSPRASGFRAVNAQSSSSARSAARTPSWVSSTMWIATPGMRRAEVGEHAEQVVRAGRVDAADPQLAAQQAGELLELGVQAVDLGEHALRVAEDDAALGGELDLPARAPEDLDAELGLEPPDLLRDRRLGEVQLLGGLRERPVAGDGGDGAKVTELHDAMVPGGEREVEVALLRPAISARDGSRVYACGSARRRRASSIAAVSGVIPPAAAS